VKKVFFLNVIYSAYDLKILKPLNFLFYDMIKPSLKEIFN